MKSRAILAAIASLPIAATPMRARADEVPTGLGVSLNAGLGYLGDRAAVRPTTLALGTGNALSGGPSPFGMAMSFGTRVEWVTRAPGRLGREGGGLAFSLGDTLAFVPSTSPSDFGDHTTNTQRLFIAFDLGVRMYFPVGRQFIAFAGTAIGVGFDIAHIERTVPPNSVQTEEAQLVGLHLPFEIGIGWSLSRSFRLGPSFTYALTTASGSCMRVAVGSSDNTYCGQQVRGIPQSTYLLQLEAVATFR